MTKVRGKERVLGVVPTHFPPLPPPKEQGPASLWENLGRGKEWIFPCGFKYPTASTPEAKLLLSPPGLGVMYCATWLYVV